MSQIRHLRAQAYNNAVANHRLLTACAALSPEALAAPRVGFFPSILRTLNHILTVDWFYVSGLEGSSIGPVAYECEIPCPEFADLSREQRAVDARLIAVCERLDAADLAREVELIREDWIQREPVDRVLLHLFQHQVHHRGQVHAMLSSTAVAPPQLDVFFLGHERERALRAEDFAALGFDEERIWR